MLMSTLLLLFKVRLDSFRCRFGSGLISTGKAAAAPSSANMFMPFGTATLISYTTNTSAYKGSKTTKTTEAKKSSQPSQSTVAKQIHKNVTSSSQQSHSIKVNKSSQQSRTEVTSSSQESHQGLNLTTMTNQTVKKEEVSTSSFIQEGIRQIQKLTAEASGSSHEGTKMAEQVSQVDATSETRNSSNCTFTAVDVEMRGSLGAQGGNSVQS